MRRPRARGSVLVLVLWTLSLFAVYAVSLGVGARARAALLSRTQLMASLQVVGYSGVEAARSLVLADTTTDLDTSTDNWADARALLYDVPVGDGVYRAGYVPSWAPDTFRPGLVDEQSKVNLNNADAAVIARLLENVAKLDREKAEELSYDIVDWRDQDSNFEHPQYGAEKDYYDQLKPPYPCKNAPFETMDELLLIKGINREIFDKIAPFVTIYGEAPVNINTASRETLLALGLNERTVDKILRYRAGTDEKLGTADDAAFGQTQAVLDALDRATPPLDGEERAALSNLILADKLGTASDCFGVHVVATAKNGATMDVDAVIDHTGRVRAARFSGVKWPSKA